LAGLRDERFDLLARPRHRPERRPVNVLEALRIHDPVVAILEGPTLEGHLAQDGEDDKKQKDSSGDLQDDHMVIIEGSR